MGFPDSSVSKESACDEGDLVSIPGSGRSPGEGIGYLPQYSWTSLGAQLVTNLPAIQETWVWSLGWEDPLEKGKAAHSSILAWRIPCTDHLVEQTKWLWLSFQIYSFSYGIYIKNLFNIRTKSQSETEKMKTTQVKRQHANKNWLLTIFTTELRTQSLVFSS